jgi:hypothetical protein
MNGSSNNNNKELEYLKKLVADLSAEVKGVRWDNVTLTATVNQLKLELECSATQGTRLARAQLQQPTTSTCGSSSPGGGGGEKVLILELDDALNAKVLDLEQKCHALQTSNITIHKVVAGLNEEHDAKWATLVNNANKYIAESMTAVWSKVNDLETTVMAEMRHGVEQATEHICNVSVEAASDVSCNYFRLDATLVARRD